jgi:hypothetical protein
MPDTRGTGRLARMLAEAIEVAGLGTVSGVTRHQLFEGPGVPMTSHNSAAAIVVTGASARELRAFALAFLLSEYIAGSDPGLAVLAGEVPDDALAFARRAQGELVAIGDAEAAAQGVDVTLDALGTSGSGTIGALSAALLRRDGNDGRFVGLPGIRDLEGRVPVAQILDTVPGVTVVDEESGEPLAGEALVDTGDWLRPRVVDGAPLVVTRRGEEKGVWTNADRHLRKS